MILKESATDQKVGMGADRQDTENGKLKEPNRLYQSMV